MNRVTAGHKTLFYGGARTWAHDTLEPLYIDEGVKFNEGVALQNNSEFTELFNRHIFKLLQTGAVDRVRHMWMDRADGDYWVTEAVTLGYENVLFPFAAVVVGALLALLFMSCEFLTHTVSGVLTLEVTDSGRIYVAKKRRRDLRVRIGKYLVRRAVDSAE